MIKKTLVTKWSMQRHLRYQNSESCWSRCNYGFKLALVKLDKLQRGGIVDPTAEATGEMPDAKASKEPE